MLDYLTDLLARAGHWGYLVIGLGAMLESAAFIGVVVPGESIVLIGGFFAGQGAFDLDALILVIAIGAIIGDSLGYEIGRRLGRPSFIRYGGRFGITEDRVKKADRFFRRHGGKAVFLGRFVGFARALVPFLAGSSEMRYRRFFLCNALGACIWSSVVTLLGYFLGASWGTAEKWIGRASLIVGGIILFAFLQFWTWRWLVRHETIIKIGWNRLISRSVIVQLRRKFAPQIAFLQARISPQSYLGLRLTLGTLILTGAAWIFGGIAEDVVTGDPLTHVDIVIAQWLHAHAIPPLTAIMIVISDLHDTVAMTIWIALVMLVLLWRRHWYWLLTFILTVPLGMFVNVLMKHAFQRARPHFEHPLVVVTSYSFPSGHTAVSTLFYGFLCAWFISTSRSWSATVWAILLAFAMVVIVALSRIYLGAHYLSDVLAAMAEGIAWLAICLTCIHTYRVHRQEMRGRGEEGN
ncbi:MAG TPA: bifunctional DedA family/phosphatase PAP2 family protein [Burkholderiaceae bacterium]|nr:bifunctional DedA family/phosphatase PAP2 family protein [Burkholderiaceae bacterium]